jgi:hypothetical protein
MQAPNALIHYTLNTGHSSPSPRSSFSDRILRDFSRFLRNGTHPLPQIPSYTCRVTLDGDVLLAAVYQGDRQCVTFGVAPNDDAATALWPLLERLYLNLGDLPGLRSADLAVPHAPFTTPWCAVISWAATTSELRWLGDFERCLAWGWVEELS